MNKKSFGDAASLVLREALDILMLKQPLRTALGAVVGVALHALSGIFEPLLEQSEIIRVSAVKWWGWIMLGVAGMHLPTIWVLGRKPAYFDESIEDALSMIELVEAKGDISEKKTRQLYLDLAKQVLIRVELKPEIQQEIDILHTLSQRRRGGGT